MIVTPIQTAGEKMKYLLVLGNGFSMDLLDHLGKLKDYPISNLLSYGDRLCWPATERNAFISFRNTPNLWILGVRPNNSPEKNTSIIENVITCANAIYMKRPQINQGPLNKKGEIYRNAYKELVSFLKFLFIHFDSEVGFSSADLEDWHWTKILRSLNEDDDITEVNIITFNYDLWVERSLHALGIEYRTSVIDNGGRGKFKITKPHGSISFLHNSKTDVTNFNINYNNEISILEGNVEDFVCQLHDLKHHSPITPLIPPAGDSTRFELTWAGKLRTEANRISKDIGQEDKVVLCGISYWHVDRNEIDEILLNIDSRCDVAYINPSPSEALDAVLTSLFEKYEHYTSAKRYAGWF